MPPDLRSASFVYHSDVLNVGNCFDASKGRKSLRRRLQDGFDDHDKLSTDSSFREEKGPEKKDSSRPGKTWHKLIVGNLTTESRKALQSGAVKISKTFSNVKVTFGNISQRLKISTYRCHRLEEQYVPDTNACKSTTPQTRSRYLLGRTPTKLYSPFGIESPESTWDKENSLTGFRDTTEVSTESKHRRIFHFKKINQFHKFR